MPNWCSNIVKISHNDKAMMERVAESFSKGNFLQEFIPCPKALLKTISGKHSDKRKQRRLERTQKRNIQRYGHKDWYSWRIQYWGTKWQVEGDITDSSDDELTLIFESAWTPPVEAYDILRDMGFYIKAYYCEFGVSFAGIWEDGCDSYYDDLYDIPEELDDIFAISEMLEEDEEYEED